MSFLKLIGAALTACCGIAVGLSKRKNIFEHATFISGMAVACEKIAAEISLRRTPPSEIFRRLANETSPCGRFFSEISMRVTSVVAIESVWSGLLDEYSQRYCLSDGERDEIDHIGTVLSRYDLENAVSAIASVGNSLSLKAKELEISANKDGKVWLSVCSAVGAAVALVLF